MRFGGDDKHVGLAHGVKPAKPVPLEAGVACTLEVAARVARGTDTLIVYMKAFDAQGRDVTARDVSDMLATAQRLDLLWQDREEAKRLALLLREGLQL